MVDTAADSVAIRDNPTGDAADQRTLTYREVDEASSRLARYLIERGLGPGDFIAVAITRSVESVLAVWAIAKTGATYVPVDPGYPTERIAHMLADSGAAVGITAEAHRGELPSAGIEWIAVDDIAVRTSVAARAGHPVSYQDRVRPLTHQHVAYVIYTSGSTGKPKGVAVTHAGLATLAASEISLRGVDRDSRVTHLCSPSFDFSVIEMLLAFTAGATLVVVPPMVFGGTELAELLLRERVTHLCITPAALESVDPTGLDELRAVLCGGDRLRSELVDRWARGGRRVFNVYGPTETTIFASTAALLAGDSVHIGTTVPGMAAYVLDSRLRMVPDGTVGELYLAGPALAQGYLHRRGLSAERFVADPFSMGEDSGTRMYRTGDMVRRTVSGVLEYHGRVDFQVKIRGLRIELHEIDAALTAHPDIDYAATLGVALPTGSALASYVLPRSCSPSEPGAGRVAVDTGELAEFLAETLPTYMIPAAITVLDELPLTPVGKLDRAALPAPVLRTRQFRAPATPAEQQVAAIFTELLMSADTGDDVRVGADDDFFELGGNSLLATQATARLGTVSGTRVPVAWLFEAPTVAKLAARVQASADRSYSAPRPVARPDRIPLSYAQQRMWFLNRFDPMAATNNIPLAVRLTGQLDEPALRAAITDLVARHEVLRTSYPEHDGIGTQRVHSPADPLATPELLVVASTESELAERVLDTVLAGFDVTAAPPIRLRLLRVGENEHVLISVMHHIAGDGTSMAPLARDLMTAYSARALGSAPAWQPLPVQYADYTLWQREMLGDESDPTALLARQIAFWRDRLAGLPQHLDLPADHPRPAVFSGRGATSEFEIDATVHAALERLAQRHDGTLFMVVHTAFALLLARLSGTRDICVGTPVAGRADASLSELIGMFVNTVALRTEVDAEYTFTQLLEHVRTRDIEAFGHVDVPFERLVELLDPVRSGAHHPLFQVMLTFQNFASEALELPELTVSTVDMAVPLAKVDLELTMVPRADGRSPAGISAAFTYATDLFEAATVAGFARRLGAILAAVAESADQVVGDIDLLDTDERVAILADWNATDHPLVTEPVLAGYRRAVARHPGAVALRYADTALTYAEFDTRVNRLARVLISHGVGAETLVGLAVRRSVDLVVGMYAILTAGGAYVPVDPDHPIERIAHVLDTARPVCVLTTGADAPRMPQHVAVLRMDTIGTALLSGTPIGADELLRPVLPQHPAYVIFTSGSTGRPKGVAVSHAAIDNQIRWMLAQYPMHLGDVYLQKTATTFDVSLWGYLMPLRAGAELVVADHDGHRDPEYLAQLIAAHRVTVTDFVPSMLTVFAAHAPATALESLRDIFVIGEALPPETVRAVRAVTEAQVHNLYGPTEAAVSVTYWPAGDGTQASVPIGLPQWNTRVYVLDSRLRPVPAGVRGELYLAGDQLARGYLSQAAQTAGRFVANPFDTGARMYRTGDLVVWRAPSTAEPARLEYLGRTDFQVKFRGQRIELGEIESALLAQPGVSQAVAMVRPSDVGDRLVAYAVPRPGHTMEQRDLLDAAAEFLPAYMVPSAVVVLADLPLNASGKLDRQALPEPVFEVGEFRPPTDPKEQAVAGVFADLLGVERVGADDDFFALGGNSLLATRVVARLNEALDTEVSVRDLFDAPRVSALATRMSSRHGSTRAPLVRRQRPARVPLSLAQQRMWVLNRIEPESGAYNMPFAIRLSGRLDRTALGAAVCDVLERHEALRTRFPADADGLPYQQILPVREVLPDGLVVEDDVADVTGTVAGLMATGFDITTAAPVRLRLFSSGDDHLLAMVVHHIAADGASLAPLARDLMAAYLARTSGSAPDWPALPVQYADYAIWQRAAIGDYESTTSIAAEQLKYWRESLAGLAGVPELPADRPRPQTPSARGGSTAITVEPRVHHQLIGLARKHNATMFMVLHAALAVLLARLSGSADTVIGTPVAGRGERVLDDLVGMFVNTLALRVEVAPSAGFATLLDQVRETDLSAFVNADVPFERVVEEVDAARSATGNPLFSVVLSFDNLEQPALELPGLTVRALDTGEITAKFDLQVIVEPTHGDDGAPAQIAVVFAYAADLFDEPTVAAFARRFVRVLTAVAADPSAPVGDIDILDNNEARLVGGRAAPRPVDAEHADIALLPDLLADAVENNPDGVAVILADGTQTLDQLDYLDLDERSTRLARALLARGIGPEDLVAVGIPRSAESVLAVWAIAKTGAAFVPVDPDYPADRIAHMVADSRAVLGLTVAAVQGSLPGPIEWLALDSADCADELASVKADPITDRDRVRPLRPQHPAYVIYTSGSTGTPKGVVVSQAGLSGFCAEQRDRYRVTSSSRTLHFASPSFDASVLELLLAVGGATTMVVVAPTVYGGAELTELLRRERVTHAFITPAALTSMDPAGLDRLRVVISGGEACPPELVRRWVLPIAGRRTREFYNGYGPTETTIMTNISEPLVPDAPVTIGAPIPGMCSLVLDSRLRPVPEGVTGEHYLAGAQLARGYHDRPGLTAARFVADPYGPPGARLYRSGDLVRHRVTDGGPTVEYVGRNDFQVKVRGFRIELGEIDAVLGDRPEVDFAVTVGRASGSGATILVSYVLPAAGATVDTAAVVTALGRVLPAHMVPTAIVVLDEIPLTPVGKLDRRALPEPQLHATGFRAPSGRFEQAVASVFTELLHPTRPLGADDDFFQLGGNSLIATQAATRLGARLEVQVPVRLLFEAPTVSALAARAEEDTGTQGRAPLTATSRPAHIPLSPAQQRMWFLNQFDTTSTAYNVPIAIRLTGELDVPALRSAITDVVARHEILRTVYPRTEHGPGQVILPVEQALPHLDERVVAGADVESTVAELISTTFDVTRAVPVAMALLRVAEAAVAEHVLVMVVHHICADGSSFGPLTRDLMTAYTARLAATTPAWPPLPVQYADYSLWQRELLGDDADPASMAATQLDHWQRNLAGLPDRIDLPTDRPRPAVQTYAGGKVEVAIDAGTHRALVDLARAHNATLFMVVQAAFSVLLARLSRSADVAIGTPIAGRGEAVLDDLIGMFVNTLVFRTRVDAGEPFDELLVRQRENAIAAFANADIPFERLVEVLNPARSTARHPLFQVGLSFQNLAEATLELPGLSVSPVSVDAAVSQFDLHLIVSDSYTGEGAPAGIGGYLTYAHDLFDQASAQRIAARFTRLLAAVAVDPAAPVGAIEILGDAERADIFDGRNRTDHVVDPTATLASLLDETIAATPHAVALVADTAEGTVEVTYGELDARVNRLARYLISMGVGPENRVALVFERSIDLVVAMYAVTKSGAAYVPVDPSHPVRRVQHILATTAPVCVLAGTDIDTDIAPVVRPVDLDLSAFAATPIRDVDRVTELRPAHTAYVIFTSGSTGQPKGVAVPHAAIVNQLVWKAAEFGLDAADAVLLKTTAAFDLSVWEFWTAAICGGRLVIAAPDGHRDPAYLAELMTREWVTTLHAVPSMLDALVTAGMPDSVWRILAIGEALPAGLAQRVRRAHPRTELFNLYGPTETAVSVTSYRVHTVDGASVPIGVPAWNTRVYVLDELLRPVPDGVVGELYLAGAQLARGYHGRPELTADRFVADPFGTGGRMYRTGDLVSWNGAGELGYHGRDDSQVKVHGFRIELGEIEAALLAMPAVARAAAMVRSHPHLGDRVVAYVVATDIGPAQIVSALREQLPSYLVPADIVILEALPLTANGKLDRSALPEPDIETMPSRAPSTPFEEIVAGVFADVLGVGRVGADDDFFARGGNSLLATQVAVRIGTALGTTVPVRALFEAPTVAGLAALAAHGADHARPALVARPRPDRIPLSLPQQRMWFLNQFDTDSAAYNVPVAVRLTGELDVAALGQAVADLITRHEILRTVYPKTSSGPVQVVLPANSVSLDPVDVAGDEIESAVAAVISAGFDVTAEVPLRIALFRIVDALTGTPEHVLAMVIHHICGDGSSVGPMTRDLMTAYMARSAGSAPTWTPLAVQYADYSIWQRELLGAEDDPASAAATQLAYWTAELADLPDQLDLPSDRPRPATQSYAGGKVSVRIDAATHQALIQLARSEGATLFMVLHTAFAVLLARLSGGDDIAIGTPTAGRGDAVVDELIGMFVNTLVFRTRVDPAYTFPELLARQRETDIQAFTHADVPFERLVEVLNPVRSTARHPLFQVGLSFQNFASAALELPGLTVSGLDVDTGISQFDLHLIVADGYDDSGAPTGIEGVLTYASDLFDDSTAHGFADRLIRILTIITSDTTTAIGDLEIMTPDERQVVLVERNSTAVPVDSVTTLSSLFAATAASSVDTVAVAADVPDHGRVVLTYGQLEARVNRLARYLISRGVGPETRVALALRRSVDLVVAMYAVAASGGAYVPVDPDQPAERIGHILETAAPICVLTTGPAEFSTAVAPVVSLADLRLDHVDSAPVTDADRIAPLRPQHTAYVIFTSGSTGRPKGVAVTHAAIVNQLRYQNDHFGLSAADTMLLKTAATFDLSVWEFWGAAACGGRMVIAAPDGHRDPSYLSGLISRERVSTLHVVPSMLDVLLTAGIPESVRRVLAIGEELPATLARRFRREHPHAELFNLYGPTEAAVSVTSHLVTDADELSVPIGTPQWNSRVYVLDRRLRPVPAGVVGELYLAGAQLARAYYARPDLTAERFTADPFAAGDRMYRTGDLVAWNRRGELEFRGRSDFQVKIRGFRIELGEIEAALLAVPSIARTAVIAHTDARAGDRLVAYLVPSGATGIDIAQVVSSLEAALPSYMVPAAFVVLDALPLNVNGKLDRSALPEPEFATRAHRAPSTPIEEIVAGAYAEVLGRERVGAEDDFFALGGTSLLATQVVARVAAALDTTVGVRELFEAPTVAELAVRVERHAGSGSRRPLVAGPRPEHIPLSAAQRRMWFLNQFEPASAAYNIPVAIRLTGRLDVDALRSAVIDVVDRHESLRTLYPQTPDGPIQRILDTADAAVALDVSPVDPADVPAVVHRLVTTGFDVTTEVPFRIALLRPADHEFILVFVAHHVSADGWSMAPLTRDLMLAYAARAAGMAPGWSAPTIQYADYGLWQHDMLGSIDDPDSVIAGQTRYWRNALAELPEELALPTDRPRPAVQTFAGDRIRFEIDADVHRTLRKLARDQNATLFMVVHAALAVLLARISGTDDIAIGAPVAGRGERELDDVIGMFVNTLVLRTRVPGKLSFEQLLAETRSTDLQAFAHADLPFEHLVELLEPERSTGRHPLFQVALTFDNLPASSLDLPGLQVEALDFETETAKFDLSLTIREAGTSVDADHGEVGMYAEFGFASDLFDPATVRGFADRFGRILAAVACDPTLPVGDIDLLTPEERAALLPDRVLPHPVAPEATLPELVGAQARHRPEAMAVRFDSVALSYGQLYRRANQVARALAAAGAGPETLVAVAVERTEDLPVALLGVLTAGAAYLPIDLAYPVQRLRYVLADAAPVCVLTTADRQSAVPEIDVPTVLLEQAEAFEDGPMTDRDRTAPLRPDNLAYVIYTSGSTGMPKGVGVTHRNAIELFTSTQPLFEFDSSDVWTLFHSFAFDFSVWELWCALVTGGSVVVVDYAASRSPELLRELLIRERVTVLNQTPSAFYQLVAFDHTAAADDEFALRYVIFGGEALDLRQLGRWYERHPVDAPRLVNMYGITETTVHVSFLTLDEQMVDDPASLIGRALPGLDTYVLDRRLHPAPVGTPGEIHVAGAQLSRGYRGRPGLTATRFVADPFGPPGSRMYRSGDLARWAGADAGLAYAGRGDQQVQLRGFRIELGEIESAMLRCAGVRQALAVVHADATLGDQLVGYVLPEAGVELDPGEVRTRVGQFLTGYMVPATIMVLDTFPLTANGKLDRRALPAPRFRARAYRAPAAPLAETVAASFAAVLGVERFGMDDNFFEQGGNSLIAAKLTVRLSEALGTRIPVMRVFTAPTPAEFVTDLARRANDGIDTEAAFDVLLPLRPEGSAEPLFCIHPVSGISWSYAGLAAHLDADRPIYGLQTPVLAGAAALPESIEEWAQHYLERIRSVQPSGPYHLLAWSFGGVIAHEIAVRMRREGEQVAVLAVMDSYMSDPPGTVTSDTGQVPVAELIGGLLGDLTGDLGNVADLDWAALPQLIAELPEPFASFGAERVGRILDAAVHSVQLRSAYTPPTYHGDVIYFTAGLDDPTGAVGATIWGEVVDGTVHNHVVTTTHWRMTTAAGLSQIAAVLKEVWHGGR
ncbi:non-ribosomal peptide synthase/polyketide synthase [Nocardia sp. NPDC059180]|uniref:non-ribosomal peptide synthetase n=1 Tax=Nocardia sp. NPDC059180 TaxID=3346761 RepID=UPI0036AA3F4F